ncbi:MAG: PKD domain-containing protein, partial [Acidimicrobiales bacterium]
EFTFATTGYRRIRNNRPGELTFGPQGNFNNFNPVAPFVRNPLITGPVGYSLGATFNLLSQARGDAFGLALQATETLPYTADFTRGVANYGVSTTEPSFVENVLADKWIGNGELVANLGFQHPNTIDAGGQVLIPQRDNVLWSFGVVVPRQARVQAIVELGGNVPFGAGASTNYFGPTTPMDSTWGIRVNPLSWMGLNAAYRLADHTPHANSSGFVFGVSIGPAPRAVVVPPAAPMLACSVDNATVQAGTAVHLSSRVSPAGLPYTYTWTATGGTLTPANEAATLDTTGLAPGMYTVHGTVTGSNGTATCNTSVEVREVPKHPPTVACSVEPSTPVQAGATVTFSAQASSPDNRPLTYAWQTSAGRLDTSNQATA